MKILVYKSLLTPSGFTKLELLSQNVYPFKESLSVISTLGSRSIDMKVPILLRGRAKIIQFEDGASLFKIKFGKLRKGHNSK